MSRRESIAISLGTPIAEEENALAIDAIHDTFALRHGSIALVAVIPVTGLKDFNRSHGYTCGFHVPELVMTYQSGSHCDALDFSVQLKFAHAFPVFELTPSRHIRLP